MKKNYASDPQGLLPPTFDWYFDFEDSMYYQNAGIFSNAKAEFDNKNSRKKVQSNARYPQEPANFKFWVGMYGSMLKRVLESTDPNFKQQGTIIGIVFEWYEKNGVLELNLFGANNKRKAIVDHRLTSVGDLYGLLQGNLPPNISFTYPTSEILRLLGFKDTYPDCKQQTLTLYPVITDVIFLGSVDTLFSLACTVPPMSGNKGDSAYAPPCPPFCYP